MRSFRQRHPYEFVMTSSPDPIDIAVGARIRASRNAAAVSQTKLAESIGLTFQQVQKYERGTNRVSASVLVRIAATLQTTASALLGETGGGAAPGRVDALKGLGVTGAFELVESFGRLGDEDTQKALVRLVRVLARATER
jgi:transcriptional regulator with XRE-family HTH domain